MNNIIDVIEALEKDKPNDKKSYYWDGEQLSSIEDEMDDEAIMDGHSGEFAFNRMRAQICAVYSVDRENLLSEKMVATDTDTCFASASDNRFLRIMIESETIEEMIALHEERVNNREVLNYELEWKYPIICEATVMVAPNGKKMIGLRFIKEMDNQSIVYEYGGIGNYTGIISEAKMMAKKTIR